MNQRKLAISLRPTSIGLLWVLLQLQVGLLSAIGGWQFDTNQASVGGVYSGDYEASWTVNASSAGVTIVGRASATANAQSLYGSSGQLEISQAQANASGEWNWVGQMPSDPVLVVGSVTISGTVSGSTGVAGATQGASGSANSYSWFAVSAASNSNSVFASLVAEADDWGYATNSNNVSWSVEAGYLPLDGGYSCYTNGDYSIDLDFSYWTSTAASKITAAISATAYARAAAETAVVPGSGNPVANAGAYSEADVDVFISVDP